MYKMPHFTENNFEEIIAFMNTHPFITLIGNDDGKNVATQVPVLIEIENEQIKLRGHIMRGTDHYKAFLKNNNVLALFTSAQCYISASWYSERGHGGTWNYMTVHTTGNIKLLDNDATLILLKDLTNHFEQNELHPELVEHMTANYIQSNLKAIAAFEIMVESIYPIFKLSQNKDDASYKNIITKLNEQEQYQSKEIAKEMIKRRPDIF